MGDIELEIRISNIGGRQYRALVVKGPSAVGGSQLFELPEDRGLPPGEGDWRDVRRRLSPRDKSLFRILTEQGKALFKLVFEKGDTNFAFHRAYELARERQVWFRLQFSFDDPPDAADLPWEALVGADGNALALLPQVSIERRLIGAPSLEVPRVPTAGKIRALIAGACPRDLSPIEIAEEKKWIKSALGKLVDARLLEHTSLLSLGKELATEPGFDLVHFFGHGDFDAGEGGLWLEDESGDGVRLSSLELPPTLRRPVSFVFLNVCHGGHISANPFAGLAGALLRSGVRAVVAMHREISDKGAVTLAKHFYKCVGQGETLTRALAKARHKVRDAHHGDWAVPMLYLAGEDFALLPAGQPPPVLATPTPEPVKRPLLKWIGITVLAVLGAASAVWLMPLRIADSPPPCHPPALDSDPRCPTFPGLDLPLVQVEAKDGNFCLGKFEVTRGQYAQVVYSRTLPAETAWLPQEDVSWNDTQSFAEALRKRNPQAACYLPSEAQWEAAAGNLGDDSLQPANCEGDDDGFAGASCAGSFPANGWGLYDMKGNVWEWTADSLYPGTPAVKSLAELGAKRVRRGGSYLTVKDNCHLGTRAAVEPERKQEAAGFRIACDPVH